MPQAFIPHIHLVIQVQAYRDWVFFQPNIPLSPIPVFRSNPSLSACLPTRKPTNLGEKVVLLPGA